MQVHLKDLIVHGGEEAATIDFSVRGDDLVAGRLTIPSKRREVICMVITHFARLW